jgi:peptidoglycan/LPS O-acetylase OafA/YrhL
MDLESKQYRPSIDGLRAIAVIAVVAYHAFPKLVPGGFVGIDIFFVISGYLITGIIIRNLASGSFSFADFYSGRIRRILPALLVVLSATWLFGWLYFRQSASSRNTGSKA